MGQRIFDKAEFYIRKGRRDKLRRLLTKHKYLCHSHEVSLVFSAVWNNPGILPWLLQHGVQPDCRLGVDGNTPLMQAASENQLDTMRLLINAGAAVNARNEQNETPLGFACAWEQWDAAKMLIDCGADVNTIEDGRTTFLDWATTASHTEGIVLLKAYGAKQFCELTELERD